MIFETERLYLREMEQSDFEALLRSIAVMQLTSKTRHFYGGVKWTND